MEKKCCRELENFNSLCGLKIKEVKALLVKKVKEKGELLKWQDQLSSDIEQIQLRQFSENSNESNKTEQPLTEGSTSFDDDGVQPKPTIQDVRMKPKIKPYRSHTPKIISLVDNRCYFIPNLHSSISKTALMNYFSDIGMVDKVFINETGDNAGALVFFQGFYEKMPALTFDFEINGHVMKAIDKSVLPIPGETKSLMVSGNIAKLSESILCDYFRSFGEIVNYSDTSKRNSKYGWKFVFIKFRDSFSVEKAVGECKGFQKLSEIDVFLSFSIVASSHQRCFHRNQKSKELLARQHVKPTNIRSIFLYKLTETFSKCKK